MSKNFKYQLIASLFTATFMVYLYFNIPQSFQDLDNRLRDFMFQYRGSVPTTGKVAIADIDERSLAQLGQWPWSRKVIAQIIDNLHASGASVIGLDMVFAEEDKRSDAYIIRTRNWKVEGIDEPEDYDGILGDSVGRAHAVLGYVWNLAEATPNIKEDRYPLPVTTVDSKKGMSDSILQPLGVTPNLAPIQLGPNTVEGEEPSAGFFNNLSDSDGIIRRVPMLMKKESLYYPSLALEMYCRYKKINSIQMLYDQDNEFGGIAVGNQTIPTDKSARFLVNFRGPQKSFDYISIADIYNNTVDVERIKGKLILLGTSAIGLLDIRAMPVDTDYPGVEVHANIIDNLIKGDFLTLSKSSIGQELLLMIAVVVLVGILMGTLSASFAMTSVLALAIALFSYQYYSLFSTGTVLNILFPYMGMFIMTVVSLLLSYILEGRTKELIRAKFAQKVSPDVVEELMKDPNSVNFAGMDKEITVFFSDVRSFTSISEKLGSAEKLIALMNDYMTPMVDIIIEEKGTIDKFIGDAIMAYWNAPKDLLGHQDYAVRAALKQLKALDSLNEKLKAIYDVEIKIGIGLNTGIAVVGEMGSHGRSDYTVIGDPVNLGSRLEGLCKPYGVTLIISEFTKAGLKEQYVIRDLDLVRVKGKELPVAIYEVIDFGLPTPEQKILLDRYHDAHSLYKEAKFSEALTQFRALQADDPRTVHSMYMERCEHYIENPPEHFDGAFTFTTK